MPIHVYMVCTESPSDKISWACIRLSSASTVTEVHRSMLHSTTLTSWIRKEVNPNAAGACMEAKKRMY